MGTKVLEVIPFRSFKEKIRLTKEYKSCKIEVMDGYLIIYPRREVKSE